MRVLAVIVALLTVPAFPAHAQMSSQHGQQPTGDNTKQVDPKKAKADENAYKDALKRIPDPKEKYDPWAVTKTPDGGKKPSK
jgi:hypothetical protein